MTSRPATWHQTRVTVMGLGAFGGGAGLAHYLATQGATVTVTDLQPAEALQDSLTALADLPIRFILGEHREQEFCETDVVFVNPAVPLNSRYLEIARQHQIPLDSEINLFVRECKGSIIGITGSVGKSTTTSFLGSILQLHDPRTHVGGNIGGSLLPQLASIEPDTPVVLELSSFQLEHLAWQHYSPPIALVLNLTPNHLDRHGDDGRLSTSQRNHTAVSNPDRYRNLELGRSDCPIHGQLRIGSDALLQYGEGFRYWRIPTRRRSGSHHGWAICTALSPLRFNASWHP